MKITEFLTEAPNKTAVVTWGRMNPPTIGHQKVVDTVKQYAQKFLGDPILFLSKSQKPKTDPLSFAEKVHFAEQMFSIKVDRNTSVKTIIQMFQHLQGLGYDNVILVAGSDRVQQYQDLMDKYNGKPDQKGEVPFKFANMKVVSSGERDPDDEGVAGMSASKLRSFAVNGDFGSFKSGVPGNDTLAKQMYNRVRAGMGLEVTEVFGFATRNVPRTTIKKKSLPQELSVADKVKARRAAAAKGDKDAFTNKFKKEEAAGVGIVTKQNATKDVPVGGEYMNVKKLKLGKGKPKKYRWL